MFRKIVDTILLAVVLVGGVLAWLDSREQQQLRADYDRLVAKMGDLVITDPTLLHVQAIKTDHPLQFAWLIHVPANFEHEYGRRDVMTNSITSNTIQHGKAFEYIARLQLRDDSPSEWQLYSKFAANSSRRTIGDASLAEFLRKHRDQLQIEQLGTQGVVTLTAHQAAPLLKLSIPPELIDEARRTLTPDAQREFVPVLLEVGLGPKKFWP